MTICWRGQEIAKKITERFPDAVTETGDTSIVVKKEALSGVAVFLKDAPGLEFDYLNFLTAVDYYDYFEVVYQLTSLKHNHSTVIKTRCFDRTNPSLPSVVGLWRSADYQERETYDLFGIKFEGHPNLKHIVLWEGFKGYPLRKDYLEW